MTAPVVAVKGLVKHFELSAGFLGLGKEQVVAVDGVSFELAPGEILGLVGESGCGKSTLGRMLVRLIEPTSGEIRIDGEAVRARTRAERLAYRRRVQMIFQDPYSSLNPRMTVGRIVAEPLVIHGLARRAAVRDRVAELFAAVGLRPDQMGNYPHEFSGGQRQRLGIARALAVGPSVIVADEPVSALDVSIQAQILNLVRDLQEKLGVAFLFISHDIAVVAQVSQRVAVMYQGRIVETGRTIDVLRDPQDAYTAALLASVPMGKRRHRPPPQA